MILRALGVLLCSEAVLLAPSLAVSLIYREGDAPAFLITLALLLVCGLPLMLLLRPSKRQLQARDGFALVGGGWVLLSAFGALPFVFTGAIPSYVDAFFETVSGFTTTGASILRNVEALPHGLLFWRSFTHWVGGMGVLVLTIAILPQLGSRNMEILRAESPGPSPEKLVPRLRETAKLLYLIYLGMTVLMAGLLLLTRMPLFDALVNTFATAGTGGFAVLNASIGGYNNFWAELIIGAFMLLFGVNFAVYFSFLVRRYKKAVRNEELLLYVGIVAVSILIITLNILPGYKGFLNALRYAAFQVSSVITTTGFATANFDQWPTLSKSVLLCLMIIGACAGSTGGGIKVSRLLLLTKTFRRDLSAILHPRLVRPIIVDGKRVEEDTLRSVLVFFFGYVSVIIVATLVVSANGFDFISTFTAVISATGNIGPGLGMIGPVGNYADFSNLSKLTLSMCMLIGRLEIMPILLLLTPSLWRRA